MEKISSGASHRHLPCLHCLCNSSNSAQRTISFILENLGVYPSNFLVSVLVFRLGDSYVILLCAKCSVCEGLHGNQQLR